VAPADQISYPSITACNPVTLKLTVLSGPSRGASVQVGCSVVEPSGTAMTRTNSNIAHLVNYAGAGMQLYYWLLPDTVSFRNVNFREATCNPTGVTGYYLFCNPWGSFPSGTIIWPHPPSYFGAIIEGNRVQAPDHAHSGDASPFAAGSFTWPIPTQYSLGGINYTFGGPNF
jgi:hypothetical protein